MAFDTKKVSQITGSLSKFFKTVADGLGIEFYSEGLDDETSEVYQNTNLSLRIDGPWSIEGSSLVDYHVEVQAMLTGIGEDDGYALTDYAGAVAEALQSTIPVFDIPANPSEEVGCLDIDPGTVDSVRIVNFGRTSTSSKVRQFGVIARLRHEV